MKSSFALFLVLLSSSLWSYAQDSTLTRRYSVQAHNQLDLRNSATQAVAVHRLLHDAYRKGAGSAMDRKAVRIGYDIYSFASTYMAMIWSHEMGHYLRAKQVGGEFRIHNAQLPIPFTTMHLSPEISNLDEALSVTGGFEVNYLNVRNLQREFIEQNGHFREDLAFAFANRLMYPIYTSLIVPIDPKDPEVWIKTAGDPVHCILPVFKYYSNNTVFMPDSSVNPELVDFYNQAALFGSFFMLLDPQFYREAGAAFGKKSKDRKPIFLLGDHQNGWTYGTLFSVSPLGYELYMNNYIHVKGRQFGLYLKYGNPLRNNGIGLRWSKFIQHRKVDLDVQLEAWDQDVYGSGASGELEASLHLSQRIDLLMSYGYKSEGFVLGKQIAQGHNFGLGLSYRGRY